MSTEIVIIIVGAILVLLAIADSTKSLNLLNTKLRIPLGVIGILLIIYGGYSYGSIHVQGQIEQVVVGKKSPIQYPIEKVQVISPVAGDSVKCRILTMGVYPNSHDTDIWVLLKPSNNKYYPQSDHTNTSYKRDGEWQVITRFGGDKGESYDIIVYETDSIASQFFSKTIQNWKDSLSYPGLEIIELPDGANEVDRLDVYLKDGCRGVF
jgi:hypothetical protein